MTNRAGLFPAICLLVVLLAPTLGRAAEEPAATAIIPPPTPPAAPLVVHKPTPATAVHKTSAAAPIRKPSPPIANAAASGHARPRHAAAAKKSTRTAAGIRTSRKPEAVAQRHAPRRAPEHRPVVVRSAPPPAGLPREYAGVPVLGPDGPPPPLPPPWYDRARPAIAFAYPPPFMGPRGPMPWWVR